MVFLVFLVGWSGALAIVLYGHGHGVWASLVVPLALVFLWPVAVLPAGRIKPGGLWLTPDGLEYRKEAVSWTLAWSDLDRLDRTGSAVQKGVLPHASGLGVAAVEPLVLALRPGARLGGAAHRVVDLEPGVSGRTREGVYRLLRPGRGFGARRRDDRALSGVPRDSESSSAPSGRSRAQRGEPGRRTARCVVAMLPGAGG